MQNQTSNKLVNSDTISIAIPYHNRLDYLKIAVQSVLNQSTDNWLLTIFDNDSPESARDYIQSLNDARISYHRNSENIGMASNWNLCIEKSTTDKVCIFHADDILHPDYLKTIVSLSQSYPDAAAWYCGTKIIDENGNYKFSFPDWIKNFTRPTYQDILISEGELGLISLINGSHIFCPTLCYNKNKFPIRGFDSQHQFVADFDIITQILIDGNIIVGKPQIKHYLYRRHQENLTHQLSKDLKRFEEEVYIYTEISKKAESLGFNKLAKKARQYKIIKLNLSFHILKNTLSGNFDIARKKLNFLIRIKP